MDEFANKVVLVTGAGRGAGREVALAFARLGAVIAANDINPLGLDETVSQIHQTGAKAGAFVFDAAKRMPIEAMVGQVVDQFGHIDILVNHASVKPEAALLEMDEWDYHRTLDVNLGGPFFSMQQVGRVMQRHGGGAMVNLVSMDGLEQSKKGQAAYLASQAGVMGLTRAVATELSAYHIRVNSVLRGSGSLGFRPFEGWVTSAEPLWQGLFPDVRPGEYHALVCTVLYVCSADASSVTGQLISLEVGT